MAKVRISSWSESVVVVLVIVGLAAVGCGGAMPTASNTFPTATTVVSAAPQIPAPGTIRITGAVKEPGELTVEKLEGMPQQTVTVAFQTGEGPQQHTETGVLLFELLPPSALATQDRKNDALSFSVLAVGSDGYAALVAYGEVSPDFGDTGILLAVQEDGRDLTRPRLIVPGDVKGGRYVTDVVELHVARVAPG